jgi:hypothetical protein
MRKSIFITLGLTRFLLIGHAQARPGFVSEDIKSGATRPGQNIGFTVVLAPKANEP